MPAHRSAAALAVAMSLPALSALLAPAPARAEPCAPADLTGDGIIDFADYLEFLNLFSAMDPAVDFTGDGTVDFADYLEFLNLFDEGCPACPRTRTRIELACVQLSQYPFANFVQAYLKDTPVWISVDPFKFPELSGKTTRVYITANQLWHQGDPLVDARATGFQTITWPGGAVPLSTFVLTNAAALPFDAGEEIGVGYDVIIDENSDGVFDGCDKVDGGGQDAGFYMFGDLTTPNFATPVSQINTVSIPVGRTDPTFEDERWYFPHDIASRGQLPLVLIGHGNGHQFTWYNHLGQHLASFGMIVISYENHTAQQIPKVSTTTLDHTNTVIALQGTLGGGVLGGHINQGEIYWIGHSRGGEGVAYAWPRLAAGQYTPTGGFPLVFDPSNIKYIQSIAPVNETGTLPITSGSVTCDFMLLYGAADGDVCGCPGGTNQTWSFGVFERALARRNSVYIHGADHNDFNCCGTDDFEGPAGTAIGRNAAQAIQLATTLAAIKYYRHNSVVGGEILWRQYETFKPGATLANATVDYDFKDFGPTRKFIIDDFQTNPATNLSSSGGAVAFTVAGLAEGAMRDLDSTYVWAPADPFNGMSRFPSDGRAAVFDIIPTVLSQSYTFDVVPAARDTTAFNYLSFRAAQITHHPFTSQVLEDQVFEVELEDTMSVRSRIRISAYGGGIEEPYQRLEGGFPGWQDEFETIRIRFTDFDANGGRINMNNIAKVRFLFGASHGTSRGRLAIDDLELVK